ncbi:MAG: nickel pincer cofactor biosynthesis protein LarC [Alphaproteobacteria bacterium]|nr:nickel pincer cofactor biosynthesis protein LarC [Alphaproteobacteria bacterium]MCB9792936.1 nickel pincer cofactor biosynthesis protein LarC [Alphaproteobacteria bacterium]
MSTLWIDASAGLAGDMLCAALLDAGGDLDALLRDLDGLGLSGWSARTERARRGAMAGLRFVVEVEAEAGAPYAPEQGYPRALLQLQVGPGAPDSAPLRREAREPAGEVDEVSGDDSVDDRAHGHSHGHGHDHDHGHEHSHHTWAQIRALLLAAPLPDRARQRALAVFARLAEAEARVHGVPVEGVAFHEVGAVDSIVDIVGACLLMEQLGVERLVCTPLPLGQGEITCAHGRLSLPAPATLELLRGWPAVQDGRRGELVTPTGAALAVALAEPGPMPSMTLRAVGYGAGTWDPKEWANLARVALGEERRADSALEVEVLEAQVDDMPGEAVPPLIEALLRAGAVDAFATPVLMKKGRPGLLLTALAPPPAADAVADALLRHSSSFGLRRAPARREVLDRAWAEVATPYGAVRVKVGSRGGVEYHASPEFADCAARAGAAGVPLAEVYAAALAAYRGRADCP